MTIGYTYSMSIQDIKSRRSLQQGYPLQNDGNFWRYLLGHMTDE